MRITRNARGAGAMRLVAGAAAAVLVASTALGDTGTPSSLKSEVSRSALTTMPTYTVEEPLSAKTHTLFMGADIAINLDRDLYKVRDVFGSNWVVDIHGQEREISSREAPVNLKITPTLKLTEVSATIVGFRKERAYTFDNDPAVKLTRGMSQSASMSSDLLAVAQNAQHIEDAVASKNSDGAMAASWDQFSSNAMMTTAQYAYSNSHATTTNGFGPNKSSTAPTATNNTTGDNLNTDAQQFLNQGTAQASANLALSQTSNGNEPTGRVATMGYDALEVAFDIRSARPLHNPYVVTMTRFKVPGGKPGMVQNMVYAQSLHPIDEHLTNVRFSEAGFPYGYQLVDFQLHIYNQGEEVATNIAQDRVELTREEAFEYIKSEYIGAHPKDTLPAAPAMGKLPSDLPGLLARGKYAEAFYVKVSKEGLANEAYSDAVCTRRIDDEYLDSVVKRLRFKPALSNGKPVDGVASISLGHLAI